MKPVARGELGKGIAGAFASRPNDIAEAVWRRIGKLTADRRHEVLERSAIKIFLGNMSPEAADAEALAEVTGIGVQQTIGGLK